MSIVLDAVYENGVIRPLTRVQFKESQRLKIVVADDSWEKDLRREANGREPAWTGEKNQKRCQLVDKEIAGTLTPDEQAELEQLQTEMLAYRRKVAPLPLDDLRQLHHELLREAANERTS